MKTLKCIFVLSAFVGLLFIGCSDNSQPTASTDQVGTYQTLNKVVRTYFTGTDNPTQYINSFGDIINNGKHVVLKGMDGWDYIDASDSRVTGMVHIIVNTTWDENGEGPVHGTALIKPGTTEPSNPATNGVWEVIWNGFSRDGFGYFKMTGVGKGGNIQGMQLFITEKFDQSTYTGQIEGYIQTH